MILQNLLPFDLSVTSHGNPDIYRLPMVKIGISVKSDIIPIYLLLDIDRALVLSIFYCNAYFSIPWCYRFFIVVKYYSFRHNLPTSKESWAETNFRIANTFHLFYQHLRSTDCEQFNAYGIYYYYLYDLPKINKIKIAHDRLSVQDITEWGLQESYKACMCMYGSYSSYNCWDIVCQVSRFISQWWCSGYLSFLIYAIATQIAGRGDRFHSLWCKDAGLYILNTSLLECRRELLVTLMYSYIHKYKNGILLYTFSMQ